MMDDVSGTMDEDPPGGRPPVSPPAAAMALQDIRSTISEATEARGDGDEDPASREALDSLRLLREIREELSGWESGLIEAAREDGASWADLAGPLGVASRQAAERRYLRLRPGTTDTTDTTGEQRVQAVRDRRAADRTVAAWAQENIGALRQLAGQIIGLTDLPAGSDARIKDLTHALGEPGAARLIDTLTATGLDLGTGTGTAELAERVENLREQTQRLRDDSDEQRRA